MKHGFVALLALAALGVTHAAAAEDGTPSAPPPAPANGSAPAAAPSSTTTTTAAEAGTPSPAEGPKDNGFEFGARVGYGIPLGDAAKDNKLSDTYSGMVPIWLDAGYRIIPQLYVGAYGQFAPAFTSDKNCPSPASCSGNDIRFGANVHYHVLPNGPFDPWIGAGFGYEFANVSVDANGKSGSAQQKGFELVNLQLGADYKVTPNVRVGPFASFSLGQYDSSSTDIGGTSTSNDIKDKTLHQWLTMGIRGAYDL